MDSFIWLSSGAILLLLMLSAFFSGSETALTAASRARIHALAQQGNRRAEIVDNLRQNKERLIGGILLGNNLVNILATALASNLLIALFGEAGVAYATLAMTLLVLIFAEVLPKTYALIDPERAALAVSPAVRIVIGTFAPVTMAVQAVVRLTLRLVRVPLDQAGANADTETELRGAIELHSGEEKDNRHERAMLRSILDLSDLAVGDIMTHRSNMVTLDVDQDPELLLRGVLTSTYTRLPVWQGDPDNVVGVLHAKDLLRALTDAGGDVGRINVLEVASEPWFVPDTANLQDQLRAFQQRREHFALVVDEYGSLMGIVTLEDIIEEIVGEIDDEHDEPVSGLDVQPDGSVLSDGWVSIRDLNREFDWRLPDEEASTVAGLVLHEARLIPDVGQRFVFYGFQFEILERQRNQITRLRIVPIDPAVREVLRSALLDSQPESAAR